VAGKAPDSSMKDIHEFALQLAGDIEATYPEADVVLNATGGTKLMALGFVEVFRGIARRIIYTDTAHRRIEILPDSRGAVSDPVPMQDVLDVPRYLAAQGFSFGHALSDDTDWRERAASRKAACKFLGRNAAQNQTFIGALNALANQALSDDGKKLVAPKQLFKEVPRGRWADALRQLVSAKLLHWQEGMREIELIDVESTRFLNGGWLEEYAWHIVKDEGVLDVRLSVEGYWEGTERSKNEFDVLATDSNQLLFLECKTLRHHEDTAKYNDNDIAYKLDSLGQDARGLFGETWLLSAREPSPVLHERARQARIRLIGPNELPKLREAVHTWISGGS